MNIFQKLRSRLDVNNNWFNDEFAKLSSSTQIDIEFIETLESQLIMSDLGITTTSKIISQLNQNLTQKKIKNIDELRINLQNIMLDILGPVEAPLFLLRGRYRYRLLLKGNKRNILNAFTRKMIEKNPLPSTIRLTIDVDPYTFM